MTRKPVRKYTKSVYIQEGAKVGLKLRKMGNRIGDDSLWTCANHPIKHMGLVSLPLTKVMGKYTYRVQYCPRCMLDDLLSEYQERLDSENRPIKIIKMGDTINDIWVFKCLVDDKHGQWLTMGNNVLNSQKSGCPYCGRLGTIAGLTLSLAEVEAKLDGRPIGLIKYNGMNEVCTFECLVNPAHGTWKANGTSVLNSLNGCPVCGQEIIRRKNMIGLDEANHRLKGRPIKILDIPNGITELCTFACLIDPSHPNWSAIGENVIRRGDNCPRCNVISKGEAKISSVLDDIGIKYTRQKTFPNLKMRGLLKYDFYIEKAGHEYLIEYNGDIHYGRGRGRYDKDNDRRNKSDRLKRIFARKRPNTTLITIPYTRYNKIESILKQLLT